MTQNASDGSSDAGAPNGPKPAVPPETVAPQSTANAAPEQQFVGLVAYHQSQTLHIGPLPPPEALAEYKRIDASWPGEILAMAKNQQAHLQRLEERDLQRLIDAERGARTERRLGQIFGFVVALFALTSSVYLALHDREAVAGVIGGSTVVALVTVFIVSRRAAAQDAEAKADDRGDTASEA